MRIKAIVLTIILSVVIALFAGLTSQKPALAQPQMEAEWEMSSLYLWYDYDLLLNLFSPVGSTWLELNPDFGSHWELVEWKDAVPHDYTICRNDRVKLRDIDSGHQRSYYVTMTTVALYLENDSSPGNYTCIEFPDLRSMALTLLTGPEGSKWREVWPDFNVRYEIETWDGVLQLLPSDHITLDNGISYTVKHIAFGLVLNDFPHPVPVFPNWYVLAAAVLGAGGVGYLIWRRSLKRD